MKLSNYHQYIDVYFNLNNKTTINSAINNIILRTLKRRIKITEILIITSFNSYK